MMPYIDAKTVRQAMKRRGHNITELACEVDYSRKTIGSIVNDKREKQPTLHLACRLADYCEIGLDDLVRWG